MKVDFHFHLEEGPYSFDWMQRTARALANTEPSGHTRSDNLKHSIEWIGQLNEALHRRIQSGSYSEDWLHRYLWTGRERGIGKFGVVDHLYRFREFKPYYEKHILLDDTPLGMLQRRWLDLVCVESVDRFLSLKEKMTREDEHISFGVEADFFPGGETELRSCLGSGDWDYVIGSVHFLHGWGFDNPQTQDRFKEYDPEELYRYFFDQVIQAARSGLFDIIAHLDNLKVFGFQLEESRILPMYLKLAEALRQADVASEVNTGLQYRYPVEEMCPNPKLLKVLRQFGIPVTLSSDAHFPDDIGSCFDDAVRELTLAGYEEVVYFKKRERLSIALFD